MVPVTVRSVVCTGVAGSFAHFQLSRWEQGQQKLGSRWRVVVEWVALAALLRVPCCPTRPECQGQGPAASFLGSNPWWWPFWLLRLPSPRPGLVLQRAPSFTLLLPPWGALKS